MGIAGSPSTPPPPSSSTLCNHQVSDRVELEDREEDRTLLRSLESFAPAALSSIASTSAITSTATTATTATAASTGSTSSTSGSEEEGWVVVAASASSTAPGNWLAALDQLLLTNLGSRRRYNGSSLRDLLRVVRNKHNHFREMPGALQELMSPLPDGFLRCGCCGSRRNPHMDGRRRFGSWQLRKPQLCPPGLYVHSPDSAALPPPLAPLLPPCDEQLFYRPFPLSG